MANWNQTVGRGLQPGDPKPAAALAGRCLAPTWQGVLGLLLTAYESGTPEGRRLALVELQRMAKLADSAKEAAT